MANRSDFHSAKLPRYLKRMLGMAEARGVITNSHERGFVKKKMIESHAAHVAFKHKRVENTNRDNDDSDAG